MYRLLLLVIALLSGLPAEYNQRAFLFLPNAGRFKVHFIFATPQPNNDYYKPRQLVSKCHQLTGLFFVVGDREIFFEKIFILVVDFFNIFI